MDGSIVVNDVRQKVQPKNEKNSNNNDELGLYCICFKKPKHKNHQNH